MERFGMASLPAVTDRSYLGACLANLGDFEAAAAADDAVALATAANHPYSIVMAYFGAGRWRSLRGDFDAAIPWLDHALALCRVQHYYAFSLVGSWAGLAYAHCDRVADGVALLEVSLQHEERLQFMPYRARTLTMLGEAYLLAGRPEDALRAGQQGLAVSRLTRQRQFEAMALRLIGEVCAVGDPTTAEQSFRQALALATRLELRPLLARCRLELGILHRRCGRPADARAELTAASEMLRAMGMTYWLRRAVAEVDSLEG
jgi:tetratricopeptide (TPR) repeat protein